MSKRKDIDLIQDINECITRIKSYTESLDYSSFAGDFKTQDAVVRNLEIIGEAAKSLSDEIKKNYPEIPWRNISGTRDKLIHDYFGVNIDIVWNIAKKEIPNLLPIIGSIMNDIKDKNSNC